MESKIQATNEYVFLIRDEAEEEIDGLLLPDSAKKKTNKGKVVSVGDLIQDKRIRSSIGKYAVFHQGCGFSIPDDDIEYWVLRGSEILGIK